MAMPDKREEAELLYARESMSPQAIAAKLGVDQGTVYRWKTEAAAKGEAFNWDSQRRVYKTSHKEVSAILADIIKAEVIKIKQSPKKILCTKSADALVKYVSVVEKLDDKGRYLEVVTELIQATSDWLAGHAPEIKEKMEPHWDGIYEALKEYLIKKGRF